jgi:diguanylate cyclase (GGDEF)-like protein
MATQTPPDANSSCDEGTLLKGELAHAHNELQRSRRTGTALHRLADALACASNEDAIITALMKELPTLVDSALIGMARSNRNRIWIRSEPQNREQEERMRRYLSHRLGQLPSLHPESASPSRVVRVRHLRLVPPSASRPFFQKQDSTFGHEVPLVLGSGETGLLLVQPNDPSRFTPREREALETVGAVLSLALRHVATHQRVQELSRQDQLTGLLHKHALDAALARELSLGLRYGVPASLMLLDLDFFKTVNDRLGHATGDHVLKAVGDLIRETVRESDAAGRYQDDTFVVGLPHTDRREACFLAERLRDRIERSPFVIEAGQVRTTASVGLAAIPDPTVASVAEWMMIGEAALADAKAQGRNRVVLHAPKPPALACAMPLRCAA